VTTLLNQLRLTGQAATVAAGAGSVALVWWVGRGNPSLLLMTLFALWVLSPFVALMIADRLSHRLALSRATLLCLMLIVDIASVAAYLYVATGPPRTTPASVFLIVPLVSWGMIATVVPIAAFISHRR
jgi:ACR3 family arsenite efflux pump ArsB